MVSKRTKGILFFIALIAGGGYLLYWALPALISLTSNILYLAGMLIIIIIAIVALKKVANQFFN